MSSVTLETLRLLIGRLFHPFRQMKRYFDVLDVARKEFDIAHTNLKAEQKTNEQWYDSEAYARYQFRYQVWSRALCHGPRAAVLYKLSDGAIDPQNP